MGRLWNRFSPRPRTFAGRLTELILLTLLLTMSAMTGCIYLFSKRAMTAEAENRYHGMMELTNAKVAAVLNKAELATMNKVIEIEENLSNPDKINDVLRDVLVTNSDIVGCGVAFEPDYYPNHGRWYEPYALKREDDTIQVAQIGGESHDYLHQDWYIGALKSDAGYWSKPYYDDAGGKMLLFTYSMPLHDARRHAVGVVGADISLKWLQQQLQEIDMKNNDSDQKIGRKAVDLGASYSFIIARDGTYIVHPDERRMLSSNYFSAATATTDTLDDHVGRQMVQGHEGSVVMEVDGVKCHVFYEPLSAAHWSMAIVVPEDTFYYHANIVGGIILALMALGLIVAFIVCHRAIKHLTRPLARFAASAGEVAKGNFEAELPDITTHDEISLLHDSFQGMQQSLSRYVEDLKRTTASKAALDSELKIASGIQMSMLPKVEDPFPDRTDIDIYGRLTPAKAVGGDLFDYYVRDEKLFLCIGDVSGKGVPAALVMAVTRFLFRNISSHDDSPERIVTSLNEAMIDGNETNMFVTLFLGVLDLSTGHLLYCNAGHVAPLLIGDGMGQLPCDTNIPVGLKSGWKYSLQEAVINKQTTILLYTDGLTEAQDAAGRQFGETRIMKTVRHQFDMRQHAPRQLIDALTEAVNLFAGPDEQNDDLTMLAVQYTRRSDVQLQRAIILTSDMSQVPRLAAFVDEVCFQAGIGAVTTAQMNLVMEEAVVNVMKYAYPSPMTGDVRVEALVDDNELRFVISDSGRPFDPTAEAEVDTSLSTGERRIGGLGIHLMRRMMDRVDYERKAGMNLLTLTKQLNR